MTKCENCKKRLKNLDCPIKINGLLDTYFCSDNCRDVWQEKAQIAFVCKKHGIQTPEEARKFIAGKELEPLNIKRRAIKKQKYEEIKRMALMFYQECVVEMECDSCDIWHALRASWHYAEEFYNFAKEKQEGNENEKM